MTRRKDPAATRTPLSEMEAAGHALPAFEPVRRKFRHDGWTPERQRAFIAALADTGSVKRAARHVNMSPEGAYYLRRQRGSEGFRRAWEAALDFGVQRLKDEAFDRALNGQLDALDFAPEMLLLSFHGMPERTLHLGDPYHCQCRKTARLLEAALARPGLRIETTFQSRFGRAKWLEPATDATLTREAAAGTRRLVVAAPGFAADCLETLEELAIRGREQFLSAGGERYATLSCLNAGDAGMAMLEALIRRELAGWIA